MSFLHQFYRVRLHVKCDGTVRLRVKCDGTVRLRAKCDGTVRLRVKCDCTVRLRVKCDSTVRLRVKCDGTVRLSVKCDGTVRLRVKCDGTVRLRVKCDGTVRQRLKCDGTCAETRFLLSTIRTSPFKSAGASVQSTTSSRGVRISGSNAGYTMFRGSVNGTGYPLHSPVFPSLPLPCVTVCLRLSTGLYLSSLDVAVSFILFGADGLFAIPAPS